MADDQKPKKDEVTANDLLNLWGEGASQPASKPSSPPPAAQTSPVPEKKSELPPSAPPSKPPAAASVASFKPSVPPKPVSAAMLQPAPQKPVPNLPLSAPPAPKPRPAPSSVLPWDTPSSQAQSLPSKPEPQKKEIPKPLKPEPLLVKPELKTSVLEGELVSERPAKIEMEEESHGFGEQINEFLAELNLSRRHIFYGIGCIVLLGGLIWGGISWQIARTPATPEEATEAPNEPEKNPDEATGVSATKELGKLAIFPPEAVGETGLAAVAALGKIPIRVTPIATYILTFRQIQNAYSTDLNALLDQSTDRRGRLRAHIALLKKLLEDGNANFAQMQQEMEMLKSQNDAELEVQRGADENFFQELNGLNPQTSQDILDEFVRSSREIVRLRAQFKALKKIVSFYEQGLPRLEYRIRDMELNEEALVSGVKIYDVRGSDLELIVPANGAQGIGSGSGSAVDANGAQSGFTGGTDSLGSSSQPSIPFLPIHPSQVTTGKDFITQPGGGF